MQLIDNSRAEFVDAMRSIEIDHMALTASKPVAITYRVFKFTIGCHSFMDA